jgi:hypothetical protein
MEKTTQLQNKIQMTQIEVQNLHLQINTNWEATIVANQTKVKLYD